MTKEYMQERIDLYSDMLYKIAYLQLKNSEDAKDIVQEVFYQYIKSEKEFESGEHEKAWLIKVTLNQCKKLWRSAWFRHTEGLPKQDLRFREQAGGRGHRKRKAAGFGKRSVETAAEIQGSHSLVLF